MISQRSCVTDSKGLRMILSVSLLCYCFSVEMNGAYTTKKYEISSPEITVTLVWKKNVQTFVTNHELSYNLGQTPYFIKLLDCREAVTQLWSHRHFQKEQNESCPGWGINSSTFYSFTAHPDGRTGGGNAEAGRNTLSTGVAFRLTGVHVPLLLTTV